jgi:hypothetical protein
MATKPSDEQLAAWKEQDRISGLPPMGGVNRPEVGSRRCGINGDEPCPTDRKLQAKCPRC